MKNILNLLQYFSKITKQYPFRKFANTFFLNKERISKKEAVKHTVSNILKYFEEHNIKRKIVAEECKLMQKFYFKNQIKKLSGKKRYKKIIADYEKKLSQLDSLSSSEEIVGYLAKYYVEDMAADFDPFFIILFRELAKILFPNMVKFIKLTDKSYKAIEQIRELQGEHPIFLMPNHISNSDHIPLCLALNQEGVFQPVIVAGANLYRGVSREILPKFNCYKLQRDYIYGDIKWLSNPIYNMVFKEYNYYLWENNEPFLFYIEGTRSRDGSILSPKLGFLKETLSFVKEKNRKVFFVPISISYTVVPEDIELASSLKGKKNISEKDLITQHLELEKIYSQMKDASIYINISTPIEVTPENIPKPQYFAEKILKKIKNNIVVTPSYHFANAIKALNKDIFLLNEVRGFLWDIFCKISQKDYYRLLLLIEKEIEIGLDVFEKKGIITKINNEQYIVDQPLLIEQYANRIKHFKRR